MKTDPGACGCGLPDTDSDGDATADCLDGCPSDPNKTSPGTCGCGWSDADGCNEGCTPGYWKNHTDRWPAVYATGASFNTTFGVTAFRPDITLLQGLKREGGGINALARHAVGALLNAASSEVAFPLTPQQVIDKVKAAVAPNGNIEAAKNELGNLNEQNCPLDGTPATKKKK